MPTTNSGHVLPELLEPKPGRWQKYVCDIRDSGVDTRNRQIRVPKAHTEAQILARLHELLHTKHSPRDWPKELADTMARAIGNGESVRVDVTLKMLKMLEENRIDWLGWHWYKRDIRPAREVLDWALMKTPTEPWRALGWLLQLAWTVWGSKGLGTVPDAPPVREPADSVCEFFDACWSVVEDHNEEILPALIRGCLRMYADPTHEMRNSVAAELAAYFPPVEEEPDDELPPPKPEEQEKQDEEERKEEEREQRKKEEESGAGGEPELHGGHEIHDHTASIRRPSMRIARREIPVFAGVKLTFPHRYMLDKAVFAQRLLTEGGIMIDGSGSMRWTDADMEAVIARMPAVWIGKYFGVNKWTSEGKINGRICVLAKHGKFSKHVGRIESDSTEGNDVDLEALKLLATWPKPRLWLSDGLVCGGIHDGTHPDRRYRIFGSWMSRHGKLVEECNKIMRQHDILRVPTLDVMHLLLKRQRVTLYASCVSKKAQDFRVAYWDAHTHEEIWPDPIRALPVTFTL